jgi:hypothetical protein
LLALSLEVLLDKMVELLLQQLEPEGHQTATRVEPHPLQQPQEPEVDLQMHQLAAELVVEFLLRTLVLMAALGRQMQSQTVLLLEGQHQALVTAHLPRPPRQEQAQVL